MKHYIVFTDPAGSVLLPCLETGPAFDQKVEDFRKDGWIKILSEYIPQSQTRVVILART